MERTSEKQSTTERGDVRGPGSRADKAGEKEGSHESQESVGDGDAQGHGWKQRGMGTQGWRDALEPETKSLLTMQRGDGNRRKPADTCVALCRSRGSAVSPAACVCWNVVVCTSACKRRLTPVHA